MQTINQYLGAAVLPSRAYGRRITVDRNKQVAMAVICNFSAAAQFNKGGVAAGHHHVNGGHFFGKGAAQLFGNLERYRLFSRIFTPRAGIFPTVAGVNYNSSKSEFSGIAFLSKRGICR